jgi:hypothetical protein
MSINRQGNDERPHLFGYYRPLLKDLGSCRHTPDHRYLDKPEIYPLRPHRA